MRRNTLRRRVSGILTVGAALCLLMSWNAAAQELKNARPNVVLIIGDDISFDDFGCYGHPAIRTPHVDWLAANGLRFTHAYLTTSQCSPTRCSLITGRYPHNTGAPELHMPLPAGQIMFPVLLKQAGYYTAAAGKWHLGDYAKVAFDRIAGGGAGGEEKWIDCLEKRPKGKPFFMWFAAYDAHRGWAPDPEAKPHSQEDVVIAPYMIDTPSVRKDLAQYYDEIQRLDRYTGLVVSELKKQGVFENTLIIFMADNGRPFARCKTRLYDSGIKTPFILHWPAGLKQRGVVSRSLVSVIDIAPTILELAGLKSPKTFQGVSMLPLFSDPDETVRSYVFAEHNWHAQIAHERMVRHGEYMYIRNAHPQLPQICGLESQCPQKELRAWAKAGKLTAAQMDPLLAPRAPEELFHVSQDPHQIRNLVDDPACGQVLEHLRGIMDQWQSRTGDTVPSLDEATPDRYDRNTGKPIHGRGGRPEGGILPGQTAGAETTHDPGPR